METINGEGFFVFWGFVGFFLFFFLIYWAKLVRLSMDGH